MLSDKDMNIICGKTLAGAVSRAEVMSVFERMDELELLLDEADQQDCLGTEGWRHRAGLED